MGVPNETCVPLYADHVHMTKFDDPTNEVYQVIVRVIREVGETEPKKLAEAGKAGVFQPWDDLIFNSLGLFKDREQRTVGPKGM